MPQPQRDEAQEIEPIANVLQGLEGVERVQEVHDVGQRRRARLQERLQQVDAESVLRCDENQQGAREVCHDDGGSRKRLSPGHRNSQQVDREEDSVGRALRSQQRPRVHQGHDIS